MTTLSPETGFCIGEILEAFLVLKQFAILEKLDGLNEPINPQQINLKFTNQLNTPTGHIMDALHVTRTVDRAHIQAYQESTFDA